MILCWKFLCILLVFYYYDQAYAAKFGKYSSNKYAFPNKQCFIQNSKEHGLCKHPTECSRYTLTKNYTICGFESKICCPNSDLKMRTSRAACEKYKNILFWIPIEKFNASKYPHTALIGWLMPDTKLHWNCGGSLVSEKFVLSTAHCTTSFIKWPHAVRLSEHDLNNSKLSEQYNVLKMIIHPGFKSSQAYHDLALIELNGLVSLRTYLRPLCLRQNNGHSAIPLNVFETRLFLNKNKITFQEDQVVRMPDQGCRMSLSSKDNSLMANGLTSAQMCFRSLNDTRSCADYLDRSILVRKTMNNSYVYEIIGLFSFCGNNKMNVFLDISKYIGWIESIVWSA